MALADDPLDAVDELDGFDAALEYGKERSLAAFVCRVLARHEADVGGRPGKPLAVVLAEGRKGCDPEDLLRRHHSSNATAFLRSAPQVVPGRVYVGLFLGLAHR